MELPVQTVTRLSLPVFGLRLSPQAAPETLPGHVDLSPV